LRILEELSVRNATTRKVWEYGSMGVWEWRTEAHSLTFSSI
jgi:hypothetical protein